MTQRGETRTRSRRTLRPTAVGLLVVGALNVISVAFFVLFVGLGVDFGLQFSVRYRAERSTTGPDLTGWAVDESDLAVRS